MTFTDVEIARQNYYNKRKKDVIVSLIATALALLTSFLLGPFAFGLAFFILCFTLAFGSFSSRQLATAYRKAYKGYFIEQNFQKIFTNLNYNHAAGINKSLISGTNMINTGDIFTSNDLTVAKYKNVSFVQADAHIQTVHTDSDGNTTYTTIFKGRFMFFEFPKKFNFKLELIGRKFHPYKIPGKNPATGRKMSKISTESSEFNHNFKIFGEDGFESYYILDPAFMVKLEAIAERYKYKVLFGFINNQLLVAINDGTDSFEPPKISRPIDESAEFEKVHADIKVITDFVDQLALDRKIFK